MVQSLHAQSFDELTTFDEQFEYAKNLYPLGKHEQAFVYFRILKEKYEEQQNYARVMDCLGHMMQCLGNAGRTDELIDHLPDYKMYCDLYGDDMHKLKLHYYLGFVSMYFEQYEEAVLHYEKAKSIAEQLHEQSRVLSIGINLLSMYLLMEEAAKAQQQADEIAKIYSTSRELFSPNAEAAFLLNYIALLLDNEELERAVAIMQQFEALTATVSYKREMTFYRYVKGRYYMLLKHYEQAEQLLLEAYEQIQVTKEMPVYHHVLMQLILLYEQQTNYERAFYYSKQLTESLQQKLQLEKFKITEQLAKQFDLDAMRELAYRDALTGIHNRRYLEKYGSLLVKEAQLKGKSLYCAVFDIDSFKQINDEYGHLVGDEAIQHMAQQVEALVADAALFTRYGGDEFVLLYENVENPIAFFKQLFAAISDSIQKTGDIHFTISMGVTKLANCKTQTLYELMALADEHLYRSKQSGRNELTITV